MEKPWYVIWIAKELSVDTRCEIEDSLDTYYLKYDIINVIIGKDGVYAVVKDRYEQKSSRRDSRSSSLSTSD